MSKRKTCPSWCERQHNPVDVEHTTELRLIEASGGDADVAVELRQEPGGPARLTFSAQRAQLPGDADLSVDEAEAFANHILALVRAARSA
jgi:hypothetical protein